MGTVAQYSEKNETRDPRKLVRGKSISNIPRSPTSRKAVLTQLYNAQETYTTFYGQRFIFVPETKIFAAFTSETNLKMLCCDSVQLIGDEMSSCIPKFFQLLYTIHGYKDGLFIPLVFVLLINNNQKTFSSMWNYIKKICAEFNLNFYPKTFRLDFERNIHLSIRSIFPDCTLLGCRYHVAKAWHRKLNTEMFELRDHFNDGTSEIGNWLRVFFGLAFLPPDQISNAFCELIEEAPNCTDILMKFPDFVLIDYIGEDSKNIALYPPETWAKQPSSTLCGAINEIESFYPQLNELFVNTKSTIWNVVEVINKINTESYIKIENMKLNVMPEIGYEDLEKLNFNYMLWCKYIDGNATRLSYLNTMGHIYNFIY